LVLFFIGSPKLVLAKISSLNVYKNNNVTKDKKKGNLTRFSR